MAGQTGWIERIVTNFLFEPQRLEQRIVDATGYPQACIVLVIGNRTARPGAGHAVDIAVIVTLVCKRPLDPRHRRAAALIGTHRPEAAVHDQPAAIIPAVLVMVP